MPADVSGSGTAGPHKPGGEKGNVEGFLSFALKEEPCEEMRGMLIAFVS